MARAAVRAKQAQQAQAQAAAKPRGKRKHASGGNPNQNLFFSRLRRRQKWVFLGLALVFMLSFVALGVGSGNGNGLDTLYKSLLGGGTDAVSQAQNEIKTNPGKGYRDLAQAYVAKNDLTNAIAAMTSYTGIKKKDSAGWSELGAYQAQQAGNFSQQYQQILQASELESPSSVLEPSGPLASALGTNPIDSFYKTQNQNLAIPLYQQATADYNASLTSYENAAKYAIGTQNKAAAEYAVFTAASQAGNKPVALAALKKFIALNPTTPLLKTIQGICKQLGGSCALKPTKK
jgi:tetratricopeptide (TPR) repeat protein